MTDDKRVHQPLTLCAHCGEPVDDHTHDEAIYCWTLVQRDAPDPRRHDGPVAAAAGPVRPVTVPPEPPALCRCGHLSEVHDPAYGCQGDDCGGCLEYAPTTGKELDALIARAENDLRLLRTGGYEHTSELVSDLLDALREATRSGSGGPS